MMAEKSWFGWPTEAQEPDMIRTEDTKDRFNQRFMPPIQRDVLSVFTKKFRSHRPVEILMNAPESPFSLTVWHNRRSSNEVWYVGAPLEKNKMAKFLSTAVKNAGLHREGKKEPINLSGNLYFEAPWCLCSRELCSPTEWPQKHGEFTVLEVRQCWTPKEDVLDPQQSWSFWIQRWSFIKCP